MSYEAWGEPDDNPFEKAIEAGWIDPADQTKALIDVMNERNRQEDAEGYSPAHDDGYVSGELAAAALSYVMFAHFVSMCEGEGGSPEQIADILKKDGPPPDVWPWAAEFWKPTDRRRSLVKAGALILAEIERLDRLAAKAEKA
jgi:hypothetical protein